MRHTVTQSDRGESLVFENASWDLYEAILREYDEEPSRMSYDDGTLEIQLTLSIEHEAYKDFIGELVSHLALLLERPIARRGSATLKLKEKKKGLEADRCFWIRNLAAIRGLKRLDLSVHPPPDLVVEVDMTHSVVDREAIYAGLGVPEMWHFDVATRLTGWGLNGGQWSRIEHSLSFPEIRVADLNAFIERFGRGEDENTIIEEFRGWAAGHAKHS